MSKNERKQDLKNLAIGFAAGLAVAIGGGVKDAPYEGFDKVKFFRSPGVAAIVGPVIGRLVNNNPYVVFFASLAGERLITEAYKLGRAQMPAKFQLGEWGKKECCACPKFGEKPIY